MSSINRITKDLCGKTVSILGKTIIDKDRNLDIEDVKARNFKIGSTNIDSTGQALFGNDVTIDGTLTLRGQLVYDDCPDASEQANSAFNSKKSYFTSKIDEYVANGEVDWATFSADQSLHQKKVVLLTNADFANGTLRVHQPCMLKLSEHVSFNPNRPATWLDSGDSVTADFAQAVKLDPNRTLDWMPDAGATNNAQYFEPEVAFAYGLGFFASVAIEAQDVLMNLNGYTMQQHPEHALQQRFFATIELADQPFMPLQGPSNFGNVLNSAHNCYIYNGTLGLSSHHCIHGNDCDNVMIENVTFKDFEVASVSINGSNQVYMKNITIETNRRDIPVLGTYSAARFLRSFAKVVVDNGDDTTAFNNAMTALNDSADDVFNKVIFDNGTIADLFLNSSQLIDGPFYGLLFNPKGVAVNQFLEDRTTAKANETSDIYMINCHIANIKGKVNEIVALANPDGGIQVDTAGSVLQFFNGISNLVGDKYYYQGTVLGDAKIEFARIKHTLEDASQSTAYLGTLNIHRGIVAWKDDPTTYFSVIAPGQLQLFNSDDSPFQIDAQNVVYDIKCNGDTMFHVVKGGMGLRVDGANSVYMSNCSIVSIDNVGEKGSELCGSYTQSHPNQGPLLVGYQGSPTYGAVLSAVTNFNTKNLTITNVSSKEAKSYGLRVQNASTNSCFQCTTVGNVVAYGEYNPENTLLPNPVPEAFAISVTGDCNNIKLKTNTIGDVIDETPFIKQLDLQSQTVHYA